MTAARILAQLEHPNIVQLFAVHLRNFPMVMAISRVKHPLRQYLQGRRKKRTPHVNTIRAFASQLCDAMEYVTGKNIVFREVCTRNVGVLADERTVKLMNFGTARTLQNASSQYVSASVPVLPQARRGLLLPSSASSKAFDPWRWMAPETLSEDAYTLKTDVWSFGVLLWELMTLARTPFRNIKLPARLSEDLAAGVTLDVSNLVYLDDAISEAMQACLKVKPDERPSFKRMSKVLALRGSSGV